MLISCILKKKFQTKKKKKQVCMQGVDVLVKLLASQELHIRVACSIPWGRGPSDCMHELGVSDQKKKNQKSLPKS